MWQQELHMRLFSNGGTQEITQVARGWTPSQKLQITTMGPFFAHSLISYPWLCTTFMQGKGVLWFICEGLTEEQLWVTAVDLGVLVLTITSHLTPKPDD